jgi:2-oxoglutarate dehydrogenase E2 component (dihydrolipoamide succinyltransferase)
MTVEIVVPALGESVSEATIARWLKKPGEAVQRDEPLVELETDKVSLEIPAPASGRLAEVVAPEGSDVAVGAVIGRIEEGAAEAAPAAREEAPEARGEPAAEPAGGGGAAAEAPAAPAASAAPQARPGGEVRAGPAARRVAAEKGVDLAAVPATGPRGVVTKADVLAFPQAAAEAPAARAEPAVPPAAPSPRGREERVRMTRLRKRIAERLKEAQNTAAMLTTFNECDMSAVMALRERYRDSFERRHGVRLGFMSFFVKACIDALRAFPAVNAEIDGDEIVYKYYYHIGVAVSTDQGLVVPVLRDADAMSFADIEKAIADLGRRAREGRISVEELTGGTFTITNGGVFGSLMSTPILNPPQVGILGMHKIQNRPVALGDGSIAVRPMMYLALSYDHRIIDGREAVSFLVRVKECIEQPERLMLEV